MALDDLLTQRRWTLQDGLWLLMGIYIERADEIDALYARAPQASQDAIDIYALGVSEPLDKTRSLIDIRGALQGYRDSRYFAIKQNNRELEWPELEADYHVPFEETDFAKSELRLISMTVAKLYKRFEKTAELQYCELPYVSSEGNSYQTSPVSQWNTDYLIEWGIKGAKLDLAWLAKKIQHAKARKSGVDYTVIEATHNKAGYFEELERWLLTYPKSPTAQPFVRYLENNPDAKERACVIEFLPVKGTGFLWQSGGGRNEKAILKTIGNVINKRIKKN